MKTVVFTVLTLSLLSAGAFGGAGEEAAAVFYGCSDASAAVMLTGDTFIVADDETNVLRVYKTSVRGAEIGAVDISGFLAIDSDHPEADIEGATMAGDRIYWITSHGRNKDGKLRPNRYRFFATDVKLEDGRVSRIRPAGRACSSLVWHMVNDVRLKGLGLEEATRLGEKDLKKKHRERLAPKKEGLNIEGLAASPDGETLYMAFRNPRPRDAVSGRERALVIGLTNAREVIEKGARPEFGEPLLWDLRGAGIRSMEYAPFYGAYFVVAGAHDEGSDFALYRWSGVRGERPRLVRRIDATGFNPEALAPVPDSARLMLLSDDGNKIVRITDRSQCMAGELMDGNRCKNKHLVDTRMRTFRAMFLTPGKSGR